MLIVSGAAYTGHLSLNDSFAWLGTPYALTMLSVAALAEILAYYIPVIDNLLDSVAPVARMSGSSIRELYSTRYCYAISGLHHSSIRREAFGFNHGFGGGLAQKIDHRAAAIGRRCGARHEGGELRHALQRLRQRPDHIDPGHCH